MPIESDNFFPPGILKQKSFESPTKIQHPIEMASIIPMFLTLLLLVCVMVICHFPAVRLTKGILAQRLRTNSSKDIMVKKPTPVKRLKVV
jgi:hypothetical protein